MPLTLARITWTPGLGDPSLMGWITVAAYLVAAVACRAARGRALRSDDDHVVRFWAVLATVLFLLAVNKQLDIQSLFTQIGKELFKTVGMYENRRAVQGIFVIALCVLALFLIGHVFRCYRDEFRRLRLPLVGATLLVAFVVIRAASFHHVDLFLNRRLGGWRLNWVMELGGIGLVLLGALLYRPGKADR